MVPGGVMYDLHPNFQKKVKDFIILFNRKIDEYDEMVTGNIIFQERMKNVGKNFRSRCYFVWMQRACVEGFRRKVRHPQISAL